MYRIIGIDGKEYGPVSVAQIRDWIAARRANGDTRVLPEGSTEWRKLSDFPEFAESLADKSPQSVVPSLPSSTGTPPGGSSPSTFSTLEAELLSRDYHLDVGSCIGRGWTLVFRHFWLLVGASFVMMLISGAVGILGGVCMGGLYLLILKLIRGEPATFSDAFAGFTELFLPLFLAGLVSGLLTALGLILLIIPGIYLAIAWMPALALIADKKLDFWKGLELSRKVVQRHWFSWFCLMLLNCLISVAGYLALCVGIFVALPICFAALAYAYEDVFGNPTQRTV